MVNVVTGQGQFLPHRLKTRRCPFRAAWQVRYPKHAVFSQRAGRNFQLGSLKKFECLGVVDVRVIEQRHPDIDIKEQPHASDSLLVHQAANMLGGDDLVAGMQH